MATRQAIVDACELIAPLRYADRTWDNVGLLLEGGRACVQKLLVCNDMTTNVVQEAIDTNVDFIVSYHPPWFRSEKRLTMDGPLKGICMAAMHGISVYSPHTALDAIPDGINDWLVTTIFKNAQNSQIIAPCTDLKVTDGGYGRIACIADGHSITLDDACKAVQKCLSLKHLRVAQSPTGPKNIKTVAVCAGSGGSILTPSLKADLAVTGELTHHQILALIGAGTHVVLTEHSNSERMYLREVYCSKLREALKCVNVVFSECDKEPIEFK